MLSFFICMAVAALIQIGVKIADYIEARKLSSEVIGGVADIEKPPAESSVNSDPIKKEDVIEDIDRPDHVNSEYFTQWLEYIRQMKKT